MYKVIELFDDSGNAINVPMKSNAGTAIRYKSIFYKDIPITADKNMLFASAVKNMGIDLDNDSDLMNVSKIMDNVARTIQELAFVMAMSAKGEKMDELNQSMFIDWIEGLDLQSFSEEKQDEIWSVYSGSVKNSSNAKKKSVRRAVK
jgi:hypothetical protein